jgi:hypothetical protein
MCIYDTRMHHIRDKKKSKCFAITSYEQNTCCESEGDGTRTRNHRIDSPVL